MRKAVKIAAIVGFNLLIVVVAVVATSFGIIWKSANKIMANLKADADTVRVSPPVETTDTVKFLVAKKNLDMHTACRNKPDDLFEAKEIAKHDAPEAALTMDELHTLKGMYLKRPLRKGDFVTADDVVGVVVLPTLKPGPGMQAVSIHSKVSEIGVGYVSWPGSHVDLIWINKRDNNGNEEVYAKVLVEDVVVLATDHDHGANVASVTIVFVVALTPEDATVVAKALETGSIRPFLRAPTDESRSVDRVRPSDLLNGIEK